MSEVPLYAGTAFLTNVFLLPYLALRSPWPTTPVPREDITASDDVLKVYLTQSVFKVVLEKSTAPQIRQLIRYYCFYKE